ncbi:LPXTG cell wall anchor domain-containing protein [Kitasatospora fiedleri]|uniref:LPXTG cell wall anchor domain-containing protein n=1 Tax=Kitasatospora fiedleri TaxID=2991545 RepID=UPI00249B2580|nr:LPXTG cell wall anchor domain-containing protein [Kitasatospora fiedleri]
MLAATTAAGGTAWADDKPVVPCADGAVKLPGETPVEDGPAHQGTVALRLSGDAKPTVHGDRATYRVRITETNRTGAAYRNVSVVPVLFTQLGVMNTGNTTVTRVHGGSRVELPTRMGCDPSIWVATDALNLPLADGATTTVDLEITTSAAVARQIKSLSVSAVGAADGDRGLSGNVLDLPAAAPAVEPTEEPTKQPTKAPATSAAPTPTAPATPAVTATAATTTTPAPVAAAASARLASTGGGTGTGVLAAAAAVLLAAGGAVLYVLRRRARHTG